MNRRNFLKTVCAALAVAVTAPSLLLPKSTEAATTKGITYAPYIPLFKTNFWSGKSFHKVNLRRIAIKVKQILDHHLFEFNDDQTRRAIIHHVGLLLEPFKHHGDIRDYKICCDEKNNPSSIIDRGECHVTVWVQQQNSPTNLAMWKQMNFVMGPSA